MKKAGKAALLSALVFPGAGHVYLKKHGRGMVLITVSIAALYFLLTKSIEHAMQVLDKIQSGAVQPDMAVIIDLVTKQMSTADSQLLNIATTALIICWVVAIIDSYRVGRAQDKNK
jgi:hypothetical protein